jgi:PadR family transcriptional regulator PadR
MVTKSKSDLLHGTLDLLILRCLSQGPTHGWAIAKRLGRLSEEVLQVGQGSLYPALYRLEHRGWIEACWGKSESGRDAKIYTLTRAGAKRLAEEDQEWRAFSAAVDRVLGIA